MLDNYTKGNKKLNNAAINEIVKRYYNDDHFVVSYDSGMQSACIAPWRDETDEIGMPIDDRFWRMVNDVKQAAKLAGAKIDIWGQGRHFIDFVLISW